MHEDEKSGRHVDLRFERMSERGTRGRAVDSRE